MKHIVTGFFGLFAGSVLAATSPQFFNAGTITDPIAIDATSFLNIGTFDIFTSIPYDTQNTLYFTNRGSLLGGVGFRFDTVTSNSRKPAISFVNDSSGVIDATSFNFFGGPLIGDVVFGGVFSGSGSYVLVSATNITSHGRLAVGEAGLIRLNGKNVDLTRGALVAGDPFNGGNGGGGFFLDTNLYFNASGVTELYWGTGIQTNNLVSLVSGLNPPFVFSPNHRVFFPNSFSTNGTLISLPQSFDSSFEAFANVEQFDTNKIIQVVFVNTNFGIDNITTDVSFSPFRNTSNPNIPDSPQINGLDELAVIVQFSAPSTDPITATPQTNAISFIDSSVQQTNITLFTNFFSRSFSRPSSYDIFPSAFSFFGMPGNSTYSPDLLYPGSTYVSNIVVGSYAGFSAQIGNDTNNNNNNGNFFVIDPTNQAPRIEITADKLDMSLARMRSEGPVLLTAKHLTGRSPSAISAGLLEATLGSTNGSLVISNIFPGKFERLRGSLSAYSYVWQNIETNDVSTNYVRFHILILDQELKSTIIPQISRLSLTATNLVIKDPLTLTKNVRLQAENLTVDSAINLSGTVMNIHSDNFVGINNVLITSNGVVQGANEAFFGYDTPNGYNSFTNLGLISAVAPFFTATTFENSGTISAVNGSVVISANAADLSNGSVLADRDIYLSAGDLVATNSVITSGQPDFSGNLQFGKLSLDVTNSITDFGFGASNVWQVSDGFSLPRKPFQGDLLGTEIRTIASGFHELEHLWPAEDLGAGPDGYNNNLAVGHLILDVRNTNSPLRFTGTGSQNALYVVNLDFNVDPSIDINTAITDLLIIDENMRIYYLNSNAGDKLSTAFPDRIVRVEDFGLTNGSTALIVRANGFGVIKPNLDGKNLELGASYKMKATAGAGSVFTGWTGSTNSSKAVLQFKMRRNMVLQANFLKNPFDPAKGSYTGLYYDSANGIQHESSGLISFTVSKKGIVTGQLISGKAYRFSGAMDAGGHVGISIVRKGSSTLTLDLQLDLTNAPDEAHGTVSNGSWTATFNGGRAAAGVVQSGAYTLAISGNELSNNIGDGFGTLTIDGSGRLRFKGTLADGTKINQQTSVSKNGQWPLYVPLYKGEGSLLSVVSFTNGTPTILGGDVSWIKTGGAKGFTNLTTVIGSHYTPPGKNSAALGISNAVVVLRGGDLTSPITNNVSLEGGKILVTGTNRLSLSISLPNGLLSGSFVHPDTNAKTPIKGVVLQQQNSARGFFFGTTQSGSVLLQGN